MAITGETVGPWRRNGFGPGRDQLERPGRRRPVIERPHLTSNQVDWRWLSLINRPSQAGHHDPDGSVPVLLDEEADLKKYDLF